MKGTNILKHKRVLVVGDVMLDVYYRGNVDRISPEAPVPVMKKKYESFTPGGAANVAMNLSAAGQSVVLVSCVGNDDNGRRLIDLLQDRGIDISLMKKVDRPTTVKTRFVASNNQQLLRVDEECTDPIKDECAEELLSGIRSVIDSIDIIVISDYLKGLLTDYLIKGIVALAGDKGLMTLADIKDVNYKKYESVHLIKPNKKELADITNMPVESKEDIIVVAKSLLQRCKAVYALVTLGAEGMVLVSERDTWTLPSKAKEVYDVSGAGDTVISYLAAGLANSLGIYDSMVLANLAAGIEVGKVGTSQVYIEELLDEDELFKKILTSEELMISLSSRRDKSIVFTNGCFDLLHVGHISCLNKAKRLGDILIVGVNSDDSVRRLKGKDRPINCVMDRMEVLAGLESVDYVIMFEEDTPEKLIEMIKPNILAKGGDYTPDKVVGKEIVESYGGQVVIIPFVEGKSTTNIISRMGK